MITEDYVSFETAKALKEKGFDVYVSSFYDYEEKFSRKNADWNWNIGSRYSAPTLQIATKWLREAHNIHIQAFRYPAKVKRDPESSEYSKPWFYQCTFLTKLEDIDTDFCSDKEFETSEEAIEEGIKYCLKNLI